MAPGLAPDVRASGPVRFRVPCRWRFVPDMAHKP